MRNNDEIRCEELIIASITPQNLERGFSWFQENKNSIKQAQKANPWWNQNVLFLEKDFVIKPSECARRFMELGYERSMNVCGKGIFAVHGGIIEIWPIHTEKPWLIEFSGNTIVSLYERKESPVTEAKPRRYRGETSIEKLRSGSYVVHEDHGIGIFRGICEKDAAKNTKYFAVEYAPPRNGDTPDMLYVPTEKKSRLAPYIGFITPIIHRLGGTVWFSAKKKAREDAEKFARELLQIYAKRNLARRTPHYGDPLLEEELRASFLWKETDDQIRAEQEIMSDLEKEEPMDRVICGDVGFGKTELAVRAAGRVIASGRQVAVIAPTTILAAQHENTFCERFARLPFAVAMLSRLIEKQKEREILDRIRTGSVDCIIGTHRLLSQDISFHKLGLVIIDEEQKFGVRHKEQFTEMRSEVDVLSLSATPIPRTLSLTLARLKGISLLAMPPPGRKPISTFVLPYSLKTIREAITRELARGGQIYFLHNRIETMAHVAKKLRRIFPAPTHFRHGENRICKDAPCSQTTLTIGVIHGRMKEREIIGIMDQFRNREINILLATTIIENGLDIASANTLIVDDAARLGLAESHQLRGRIGRGETQAYAYFLYRPRHLTKHAAERLEALGAFSDLGAGYEIALRDLDIRGAGNVLGKEQSGTINKVGLNLYCQMLAEATDTLRAEKNKTEP